MITSITPNLQVPSVTEALTFYRDILGFAVVLQVPAEGAPGFAILVSGGAQLMLQSTDSMREDVAALAEEKGTSTAILFTIVQDVKGLWDRLHGDLGSVVHNLRETDYGMREFYYRDPFGYVWGFAQRLEGK